MKLAFLLVVWTAHFSHVEPYPTAEECIRALQVHLVKYPVWKGDCYRVTLNEAVNITPVPPEIKAP